MENFNDFLETSTAQNFHPSGLERHYLINALCLKFSRFPRNIRCMKMLLIRILIIVLNILNRLENQK